MKIFLKFLFFVNILFVMGFRCQKMDDSYKKFIVPGGLIYPGKAIKPTVYPGRQRVKVSWIKGTDPSIIKANIFWNNYTDSATVDISPDEDTINYIINDLAEQQYTFEIVNYNALGDKSVPSEVVGASYGDFYQASLLTRPINSSINYGNDTSWIQWGAADITDGAFATEISYIDISGNSTIKSFPISEVQSVIPATNESTIKYRTIFLPDSLAIDTFYTEFVSYNIPVKLDKSKWTITTDSYEKTGQLPNGPPEKAIDDDPNTFWHTDHTTVKPDYPHWLAVDMNETVSLALVQLTSRSNAVTADFTDFIVQGSLDGKNWTDYGAFKLPEVVGPSDFYIENPPKVRYVRIYMTKGPNYYTHLSELSLFKN